MLVRKPVCWIVTGRCAPKPPEYDNPTWPPGEPRIIFCATAWMPGTPQVVIRYRTTPGGDVQERRRPLPPKP